MIYLFLFLLLIIAELVYFRIADRFDIIDKPNERSSHKKVTLRGGGVIFYFGVLCFFLYSGFQYPWFFAGLSLIAIVSFLDDVFELRNGYRIAAHVVAVALMFYEVNLFPEPWWLIILAGIITIGTINAFNFMDGINGITGGYSLIVLAALWYINMYEVPFVSIELILFAVIAVAVFNIFNFRKTARCFAGDVGSVSIAFIILFLLLSLIMATGNPVYILLLAVYGVDSVLTILHRLFNKENIFKAHRSHLYQVLANEMKIRHTLVSSLYMAAQAVIAIVVIGMAQMDASLQITGAVLLLLVLSLIYIVVKWVVIGRSNGFSRESLKNYH